MFVSLVSLGFAVLEILKSLVKICHWIRLSALVRKVFSSQRGTTSKVIQATKESAHSRLIAESPCLFMLQQPGVSLLTCMLQKKTVQPEPHPIWKIRTREEAAEFWSRQYAHLRPGSHEEAAAPANNSCSQ